MPPRSLSTRWLPTPGQKRENSILTAGALLNEARGEYASALHGYNGLDARWQSFGNMMEQGQALSGSARCLASLKRTDEAGRADGRGGLDLRRTRSLFAPSR
jgi:hypothetical protein